MLGPTYVARYWQSQHRWGVLDQRSQCFVRGEDGKHRMFRSPGEAERWARKLNEQEQKLREEYKW